MMTCPNCGEENLDKAKFCLECGTPLKGSPMAPAEERKVVSVLFVDLVGFTARSHQADPEDVRAALKPYHERLQGPHRLRTPRPRNRQGQAGAHPDLEGDRGAKPHRGAALHAFHRPGPRSHNSQDRIPTGPERVFFGFRDDRGRAGDRKEPVNGRRERRSGSRKPSTR